MFRVGVRFLVWLLVACVPAQAITAAALRAEGPAHAHDETRGAAGTGGWGSGAPDAVRAAWHAMAHGLGHGHAHTARHHHEAADSSVVLTANPSDDEHGAAGGAGKASAIEMPGLLPGRLASPDAWIGRRAWGDAAARFTSRTGPPLYRPPRSARG